MLRLLPLTIRDLLPFGKPSPLERWEKASQPYVTHWSTLATGPEMGSSLSCRANIMLWFLLCTDEAEELEQGMVGKSVWLKYRGNMSAPIYVGWINTAVATSSWALVSICMSHLRGWETKCWDVGKLARETESLLGRPALSMGLEHASRPQEAVYLHNFSSI